MKFRKVKGSHLMGHTEVRFELEQVDHLPAFTVIADKHGVKMEGQSPYIASQEELQLFAETVSLAVKEWQRLKPKLVRTLSGH